ncbi:hypothetical protein PNIG_a2356 [Pseudoalteromonas nigrifaciens]|uniref:Uncharacterized protein n=1 Tax=Pseudoalteromonas nigrifaciens TaxID=28109 RepID=A0AAC9UKD4_9GAMM|nr:MULTISPECIES: hypothetical protein [Pseudoalteromonas]ASM54382.1 hypothetical protein PNIG_a2356 [Pseudoalteromonas nigrifaciens]MBB1370615.1 hypothetical protein [Pseudoalteromonas sp. SR45-4]GEN43087.1 hypothetical protein PNI02_25530 [Pseudoalteromonas nigrifaciens]SUC51795.1 Uncharacterised protein [Pseudoalteromonas nigrifaciens]
MKSYKAFPLEVKNDITESIKSQFGDTFSNDLILTFIRVMEESTFVEVDFADLLAFLAECKHGFKTFSNQDTLTEFVKSNQYTPKALFGHKKLLENSETNFMDDFSDSVNKLKQLVANDGFLYVSAGFNQDLSEQKNGFEFFMISCHE